MHHLYLHVPFCLRRCSYCDFAVQPTRQPPVEAWLTAMKEELRLTHAQTEWPTHIQLRTLYVGGGTPSLLGTGALTRLRALLEQQGTVEPDVEWSAEANPESFTAELARDWLAAGVNRISLGVQSFHAPALRWMGRLHGAAGAHRAMEAARAAGFQNVSVDLIFGLPTPLQRDWSRDLDLALQMEPDHVSLYGLTAEPGAALGRWVREGRAELPAEESYAQEYLHAAEVLSGAGFVHYEVSSFARPGRESQHNRAYWSGAAYLGLGPGAHSFRPPERFWNVRDWADYLKRLAAGQLPRADSEIVGAKEAGLERVWLGLRTREGAVLPERTEALEQTLRRWQTSGWARVQDARVRLTPAGWLLLDRLAVELDGLAPA
ncbi:MAG: radical SAM family heme chaperone HemW [Longimicrobiales bacterium]